MLARSSTGFGMLAFSDLLARASTAKATSSDLNGGLHHRARAKHVIFCYMSGGVSHVDSFDPKPILKSLHGKPMPVKVERTQFNNNGNVMQSPFDFKQYGESGTPVSSIFAKIGSTIDEIAVVRSMTTPVNEHAQGNYAMHTGFPFMGHPSAGAWTTYGLGTENENLPGFVVLQSGDAVPPHGGVGLFSNGFLPAQHQGSIIKADASPAVRNIVPSLGQIGQRKHIDFINQLDRRFSEQTGDSEINAAIRNYETAYRMQTAVPEVCDISGETKATRRSYGLDSSDPQLAAYARQCLLARRMVEQGVRFIELSCLTHGIGAGGAANPWGSTWRIGKGPQRAGSPSRPTDRRPDQGPSPTRTSGRDVDRLDW